MEHCVLILYKQYTSRFHCTQQGPQYIVPWNIFTVLLDDIIFYHTFLNFQPFHQNIHKPFYYNQYY